MSRPIKKGLDYFPLDTVMDDSINLIEAEFGLKGFAVVVKLFQKIYREQGYYCEWTNDVALLFGQNCGLGGTAVSEILSASIRRGIFDKNLYERYQILSSAGIQKRYLEACSRRKQIQIDRRYLLLSADILQDYVDHNSINVYINPENVDNNPQSKLKESKLNKINTFERLWELYPKKRGKDKIKKSAIDELHKIGFEKIAKAIENYEAEIKRNKIAERYIMYGSTFFNGGYKDYLTTYKSDTGAYQKTTELFMDEE